MLLGLAVVMIILAFLGALLGGNSFGESTRKGCGCFALLLLIVLVLSLFGIA